MSSNVEALKGINVLIVNGNPLVDISATENISDISIGGNGSIAKSS